MAPIIPRGLPDRHREALGWFAEHAGALYAWPRPLGDTLLATKAKGIYKPHWSVYALSVRQSLGGRYPDRPPAIRPDGTWSYLYFQENEDITERDSEYTNVGLLNCMRDAVPVGVMIQVQQHPGRYSVLGLALVTRWDGGYFLFEGLTALAGQASTGPRSLANSAAAIDNAIALADHDLTAAGAFSLLRPEGQQRTLTAIVQRRGQSAFRAQLLDCYGGRCAVTGTDAPQALEAAHILPYHGPATNVSSNGLLLRADIHTLFDLGLLSVEPDERRVVVSHRLLSTTYGPLNGCTVARPRSELADPNRAFLDMHMAWSGLGSSPFRR
jgi:putative restriction endonuclease